MLDQEALNLLVAQLYRIADKKVACRMTLKGELPRVIHVYGVARTAKNKIVVVCWQERGYTKAGEAGYRMITLDRIQEVEETEELFQVQSDFNHQDSQYKEWVFHV